MKFASLQALVALAENETMTRTSERLRITQSAVSKRIAALEIETGLKIIRRNGRRVDLTQTGKLLAVRAQGFLAEIQGLQTSEGLEPKPLIALGVTDSIMGSWGAKVLRWVEKKTPGLQLEFHVFRTPGVISRVRSGEVQAGLCVGESPTGTGLLSEVLWTEPLILVGTSRQLAQFQTTGQKRVLTIETQSATWKEIQPTLSRMRIEVVTRVESFFSAAQMAFAEFEPALIPLGVAEALQVPKSQRIDFDFKIRRRIQFVAPKRVFQIPGLVELRKHLKSELTAAPNKW